MSRRPWTKEEEQVLRKMFEKGSSVADIAEKLNRPNEGVSLKIMRLNLKRPFQSDAVSSSLSEEEGEEETKIILSRPQPAIEPKELITHEQVLKILSGALQRLQEGNLNNQEVKLLKTLSNLAYRYDALLERYERWDEIEGRLEHIEAQLEEMASTRENQETPNSG